MAQDSTPATHTLSARASRGFAWMLVQTLGSKIAGFVSQVFLARLLMPKDFGLVAIAYIAASLPTVLRQTGVPQILIQKGDRFDRWANSAFWMEMATGGVATLMVLAAAPIAAWAYHAPELAGLLIVISAFTGLSALGTVPTAKMSRDLRFRELALLGAGTNVLAAAISVACAFSGLGAYSFVIPMPICMGLRAIAAWWLAPVRVRWQPQLYRWWAMAADSGRLMVVGLCYLVQVQADKLALSIWHGKATLGRYFFATNLSSQIVQLLALNLGSVLFPVLSTLKEDTPRQVAAYLRASRALALAGVPICLAEVVLARPIILVIFGPKWIAAAAVLQVAALAAGVQLAGSSAANLLQAQGRFHAAMLWSLASAATFTVLVFLCSFSGGAVLVAVGGAVCALLVIPAQMLSAIRPGAGRAGDVASVYLPPLFLSVLALAPVGLLEVFVPWFDHHAAVTLVLGAIVTPAIYLPLAWTLRRAEMGELLRHAGPIGRVLRRAGFS
ncbi:MAG: oligosaccharide flippase family protein [Phycisphaerales bacterium]|nr:oligosaccharide flippase family protein [Phycisphaerales bacterium]